jgi:uroporphyrinogen-III synthase
LTSPPESTPSPLTGFTVGVTARRAEEFAALLQRRGAAVVQAPAIGSSRSSTTRNCGTPPRSVIADPPDIVVATTGIGFRGWIEAADGWGLADDLVEKLAGTRLLARGPKAKGDPRGRIARTVVAARGVLLGTDQRTARRGCGRSAGGRSDARRHH